MNKDIMNEIRKYARCIAYDVGAWDDLLVPDEDELVIYFPSMPSCDGNKQRLFVADTLESDSHARAWWDVEHEGDDYPDDYFDTWLDAFSDAYDERALDVIAEMTGHRFSNPQDILLHNNARKRAFESPSEYTYLHPSKAGKEWRVGLRNSPYDREVHIFLKRNCV